jgi:hypothetical protein
MACGSPDSCDSLVGSRKLLPLVPATNPANGTSEMSVPKRPFAACGKLCDRRPPFTDHSGRMIYMITADGSA